MNGSTDRPPYIHYTILGRKYFINWGQLNDEKGKQQAHRVGHILADARLSDDDIEFITALRLDPAKRGSAAHCAHFQELVSALQQVLEVDASAEAPMWVFKAEVGIEWITELFTGYATYRWPGADRTTSDQAKDYIRLGFAEPLTILLLLTFRSNFWMRQFIDITSDDATAYLRRVWKTPEGEDVAVDFYRLAGDPLNLPPKKAHNQWGVATFDRRSTVMFDYVPLLLIPLVRDLDLLVRIAAAVHPELQEYIEGYDQRQREVREQ